MQSNPTIPAASSLALMALSLLGGAAWEAREASAVYAQNSPAPALGGIVNGAFAHPNTTAPSGATTFVPESADNLFAEKAIARLAKPEQKQAMQSYVGQMDRMVEQAYTNYGFSKNDVGVAFGGLLETCWEIGNASYKIGNGTAEDKAKTQSAVRQMQNALLESQGYKSLPNRDKQLFYEACTFTIGQLSMQWQQAGSDATKRAAVQQEARQQLHALTGLDARALTRRADGAFIRTGVATSAVASTTAQPPHGTAAPGIGTAHSALHAASPSGGAAGAASTAAAAVSSGPLPVAAAHGAQIFIKYSFRVTTTTFDPLILFPDGAAFTDLPRHGVAQFDEASLRAGLKPFDVGTWKQSGDTMVLNFPAKKHDAVVTLHKVPRGWYDSPDGRIKTDDSYNTYFPAIALTPADLEGKWHSQSLSTMGFVGGGTPMVATGSSSDRVFNANGTFSGGRESYVSSTTANMGDAFKTGGDVGVYGNNSKKSAGRWRLDGLLLTMEDGGKRTVTLAFVLPHWNKTGPPEILIDGDWWQRPKK